MLLSSYDQCLISKLWPLSVFICDGDDVTGLNYERSRVNRYSRQAPV